MAKSRPSQRAIPRTKKAELSHRLAGYSVTAGAALMGVLNAEAATAITSITPGSATNPEGTRQDYFFDAGPFHLDFFLANFGAYGYAKLVSGPTQIVQVIGTYNASGFGNLAKKLISGSHLEGQNFLSSAKLGSNTANGAVDPAAPTHGVAGATATGYIGLKVTPAASLTTYAWMRVKLTNGADGHIGAITFLETDGVYGAYAPKGEDLTVGAVPEPSVTTLAGLGLLACGAVGVREMRKRRAAAMA